MAVNQNNKPRSSRATLLKTLPEQVYKAACVFVIYHQWLPLPSTFTFTAKLEELLELLNSDCHSHVITMLLTLPCCLL